MKTNPLACSLAALFLMAPVSLLADSATIKAPLKAGSDPDATGVVLATLGTKKSQLIIQARNLEASHTYQIEVGGIVQGDLSTDTHGRANVRFRTPAQKNVPVLDFEPRGATLRILDGTQSALEGVISGSGEVEGATVSEQASLSPDQAPKGAGGTIRFTQSKSGRQILRTDLSGLDDTPLKVFIDGVEKGEIHRRGKRGSLTLDSQSLREDVAMLDVDPRGASVDIVADDSRVVFRGKAEARVPGVNSARPVVNREALTSSGADVDGSASARLRIDKKARKHFSVEIEDVPAGDYELLVGGEVVGTIAVVTTVDGTEGELEFSSSTEVEPDELPLSFDPVGKTLTIRQGATVFFSADFHPNLSGAGAPAPEPASMLEENLSSTGLDADATARARYKVDDKGRHRFSLEIEAVPAGRYTLSVAGVVRGTIVAAFNGTAVQGEIEFSSREDHSTSSTIAPALRVLRKGGSDDGGGSTGGGGGSTGGGGGSTGGGGSDDNPSAGDATETPGIPLNFDPRGQTLEISSAAGVYFTHLLGNGSSGTPDALFDTFETETALLNTGVVAGARARAEFRQREDGGQRLEVEIRGLPAGDYDLTVAGVPVALLSVTAAGEGKVELGSGALPLAFAVAGSEITLQQGATVFFKHSFPTQ